MAENNNNTPILTPEQITALTDSGMLNQNTASALAPLTPEQLQEPTEPMSLEEQVQQTDFDKYDTSHLQENPPLTPEQLQAMETQKTLEEQVQQTDFNQYDTSHLQDEIAQEQINLEAEKSIKDNIFKNFPLATVLRPSIVYSSDDNFTTNFMSLLSRLPFFPLYYKGDTKFSPIHCSDLTDIIFHVISKNIYSKIIECVGPETITFKQIVEKLLKSIGKKRLLIPFPIKIAQLSAGLFELMPNPLITKDQIRILKYDNISSGKYKTNSDIGVPSKRYFNDEVKKYCYMWREGGQFSTERYKCNQDLENKTN